MKCLVLLLETKDTKCPISKRVKVEDNSYSQFKKEDNYKYIYYHMYLISHTPIQIGDYYINNVFLNTSVNNIYICEDEEMKAKLKEGFAYKIEASTDRNMNIPFITNTSFKHNDVIRFEYAVFGLYKDTYTKEEVKEMLTEMWEYQSSLYSSIDYDGLADTEEFNLTYHFKL